jgi:hypothetical protein
MLAVILPGKKGIEKLSYLVRVSQHSEAIDWVTIGKSAIPRKILLVLIYLGICFL